MASNMIRKEGKKRHKCKDEQHQRAGRGERQISQDSGQVD